MVVWNHFSLVCCVEGLYPIKKIHILQDLKRDAASEYVSYQYSVEVAVQICYVEINLTWKKFYFEILVDLYAVIRNTRDISHLL